MQQGFRQTENPALTGSGFHDSIENDTSFIFVRVFGLEQRRVVEAIHVNILLRGVRDLGGRLLPKAYEALHEAWRGISEVELFEALINHFW